jgi:hypothetical protein
MDNQVRIFREKPFGWFDKPIMRYLREKYGQNKKVFIALRATYLAICEIESDFESNAITAFNKTVGTYAGLTRQVAGKYVRLLEEEGLIEKLRVVDTKTGLKAKGTYLRITSSREFEKLRENATEASGESKSADKSAFHRVARYPTIRVSDHSDTSPSIKKISVSKKISKYKNVKKKNVEEKESEERIDYYAGLIADKLGDRKSLSYFKIACRLFPPEKLLEKASAIVSDGGARSPAAVFAAWLKEQKGKGVEEGMPSREHLGHRALVPTRGGRSKSLRPTSAHASEQSGFPAVGFGCVSSARSFSNRLSDGEKHEALPPCAPDFNCASFPRRTPTLNVDG